MSVGDIVISLVRPARISSAEAAPTAAVNPYFSAAENGQSDGIGPSSRDADRPAIAVARWIDMGIIAATWMRRSTGR